jgi:hypothetical protein
VQDKIEQIKNVKEGAPVWAIMAALIVIGTLAVSMTMMARRDAFTLSGWVCIIVCNVIAIAFYLRILAVAFQESLLHGVLYILVPFYELYYVITRWSRCGRLFMTGFTAELASLLGWGMLYLATVVPEASRDVGMPPLVRRVSSSPHPILRVDSWPFRRNLS